MNHQEQLTEKKYPSISLSAIREQIIRILPAVLISVALFMGGAAVTVQIARATNNPIWKIAKDSSEITNFPPYIGLLANWVGLLWMATATICLFTTLVLKNNNIPFQKYKFLFISGVLSFVLTIDDLFVLHDRVFPSIFHIPEPFFYLMYILVLITYIIYFRKQILQYDYLLFIAAFFLFGISREVFIRIPYFLESMTANDMLKYFGVIFWLAYFYRACAQEITQSIFTTVDKK